MAAPSVDTFVRRHLTPVLEQAGFDKDRRIYRRQHLNRDIAIFEVITERREGGIVGFEVQCGIAVGADQPPGWSAPHGMAHVQLGAKLMPSAASNLQRLSDTPLDSFWVIDPGDPTDPERVAAELLGLVVNSALPVLDQALLGERRADVLARPGLSLTRWRKPFLPPTDLG